MAREKLFVKKKNLNYSNKQQKTTKISNKKDRVEDGTRSSCFPRNK